MRHRPDKLCFTVDTISGCWLYNGCVNNKGYGVLCRNGKQQLAHRYFYIKYKGLIPPKKELDHLCRNILCVNPEHLEPVSHRINVIRGLSGIRGSKTHCKNGHEFTVENTYNHGGYKDCKICRKANSKRFQCIKVTQKLEKENNNAD